MDKVKESLKRLTNFFNDKFAILILIWFIALGIWSAEKSSDYNNAQEEIIIEEISIATLSNNESIFVQSGESGGELYYKVLMKSKEDGMLFRDILPHYTYVNGFEGASWDVVTQWLL